MALLGHQISFPIRSSNKAAEFSNLCNDVFQKYLGDDDPFGLIAGPPERSTSGSSTNLFEFSGSSKQSNDTSITSPVPSPDFATNVSELEAKQPKAKESSNFWAKTLRLLERNAARSEQKQQLRSAKSNPDFLSLGGYPSPPSLHPPIDQSLFVQRQRPRVAANGIKSTQCDAVRARSPSRGRSKGIAKPSATITVNPYATIRKPKASPSKMMNPSRYRAGFRDSWEADAQSSSPKHKQSIPVRTIPVPPLPNNTPAFSCQPSLSPFGANGHHQSPITNHFRYAHACSPDTSPLHSPDGRSYALYDPPPLSLAGRCDSANQPSPIIRSTVVPSHITKHSSFVSDNDFDSFDFDFPPEPTINPWSTMSSVDINSVEASHADPFVQHIPATMPNEETYDNGLGISYNPKLVLEQHSFPKAILTEAALSRPIRKSEVPPHTPVPSDLGGLPALPSTPVRRQPITPKHERRASDSPPPFPTSPLTEPRSSHRRRGSSTTPRRISRHRRTKSTNSTPHTGFVNFTPLDSGKILSGVAPSGSSRTKARRDREAADKRRKLSQAAVKAVIDAGGDLEELKKAGLVIG